MSFPAYTPTPIVPSGTLCDASRPGSGVTVICETTLCGACVNAVINYGTLPTFYVAKPVSIQLTAIGTKPFVWTATSGLPAGLTLSTSGVLSGTPTTAASGTLVVALANCSTTTSKSLNYTTTACVVPSALLPATLTGVTAGAPYTQTLTATGTAPVWTAAGLPSGATLDSSTGVLAWTSPVAGTYNFTVTATNNCGVASITYSLVITAAITARKGVWKGAQSPTWVAADFTTPSANFEVITNSSPTTRIGPSVFPARVGAVDVYDVIWFADSLLAGTPQFNIARSPALLNPAIDTPYQTLTIAGVSGKIYEAFTAANAGQTIDVT